MTAAALLGQVRVLKEQLAAMAAQVDALEKQLVAGAMGDMAAHATEAKAPEDPGHRVTGKRYLMGDRGHGPKHND